LTFAEPKHRKDRFFKGEQAFTMLKHRLSALMIFHDAETPLCSTVHFSDAETPLCSTVHFSDAETPPKNTGDCFPRRRDTSARHFFFPVTETSHSLIIFTPETTPSSTCFAFSPPSAATPFAATFPVAETPATFHSPPVAETPIVSNFFIRFPDAETPLFSIFHPRPIIFPTPHHRRNNSVQQLFRLFSFIHDAETPSFSTL
jgi:hypothetical protein